MKRRLNSVGSSLDRSFGSSRDDLSSCCSCHSGSSSNNSGFNSHSSDNSDPKSRLLTSDRLGQSSNTGSCLNSSGSLASSSLNTSSSWNGGAGHCNSCDCDSRHRRHSEGGSGGRNGQVLLADTLSETEAERLERLLEGVDCEAEGSLGACMEVAIPDGRYGYSSSNNLTYALTKTSFQILRAKNLVC